MSIQEIRAKLSKLKNIFEDLSLRKKLLGLVGAMSFLILVTGGVAFRDVQRASRLLHSVAKSSYPLASGMVNALHSMEFSRALAIQYAYDHLVPKHIE